MNIPDVAIVGAGMIGAACAEALTAAGLRVVVIESRFVGAGATSAGMGHIVPIDDSPAQFALTRYSQKLWLALRDQLPREVEWLQTSTIWVACDEEEMRAVQEKHRYYCEREVKSEILDAQMLADAEPNLRPGLAGGLRVPDDSLVYAPCAARWLLDRALRRGAALRRGSAVALQEDGVTLQDGSHVAAANVVIANGTWCRDLLPEFPVRPRKGHLAITDRYPGFARHSLIELGYIKNAHGHDAESVAFNVQPRASGQVLIGSSRQYDVDSPQTEPRMLGKMLRRAMEYMPRLADLQVIRTWTGFRAATPDSLPLIGPYAGRGNLFVSTGHEGLGITTSLGAAQLIAAFITGRAPDIPIEPYLPGRLPHA